MTDITMQISAVYIAVVTMMAFLYIKVRRLEHQVTMQDAVINMLMSETAPSEFLPEIEKRIDECESKCHRGGAPPQDCCSQEYTDADAYADPGTATPTTIPQDVIGSLLTSLVQTGGASAVVYDDGPEGAVIDEITDSSEHGSEHGSEATAASSTPPGEVAASSSDDEQGPM